MSGRAEPRALAVAGAVALVLLGLATGAARAQGVSPGPLARVHASLEGVDNCTRCHSSGRVDASRCFACHAALGKRVASGAGYHGRLRGQACEDCHPEHRGRDRALVKWPGGGERAFDHAGLAGFTLKGGHGKVACRGCHQAKHLAGPVADLLRGDERARTYLGLATTCASCHADPHQPSLGRDCAGCHDESSWKGGASFDHGRTKFPLRGAHGRVPCARCHPGGGEGKPGVLRGLEFASCADCHESPHDPRVAGAATCARCHGEDAWKTSRYDRRLHAPRTFPLTGGHRDVTCATCHGPRMARVARAVCTTCHQDPHRPSLGSACETCHGVEAWVGGGRRRPAAKTFHDRTAFPLVGRHAAVRCERCHDPGKPAARRYRPIAHAACRDCHADPHQGELAARADGGRCDACHDEHGFRPARFEAADHARGRFALEGAHRAVPCGRCHARPPAAPGFRRDDRRCEACHRDPHAGQFAGRPEAAGGCAGCHGVETWKPARLDRAAHARTGFPLQGAHAVDACGRCHAAREGVVRYGDTPRDCGACHTDPHAGQLGTSCLRCHLGEAFKPAARFVHATSGFLLRGRHAGARCEGCHPRVELGGRQVTVYRVGLRDCDGCHTARHGDAAAPAGSRARRLAEATRACTACHDETSWASQVVTGGSPAGRSFDHALTGAPLAGAHARAACAACHRPGRDLRAGLATCTACHADRHRGQAGERCEVCHSATTWTPDGTLLEHRRTRFPLLGAHAVQGCAVCHRDALAGDFRGLSPACETCHLDTARARNTRTPHDSAAFARCGGCHSQLAWRPAHFDHNTFYPLVGAHAGLPCEACHTGGSYQGTPRTCVGCHDGDQARSRVDHSSFGTDCERCHNTSAWVPAQFPDHDQFFPIRGGHRGLDCTSCHIDPSDFGRFTCTDCHAHSRAETDGHHDEVAGYVYDSQACLDCHRDGVGDD